MKHGILLFLHTHVLKNRKIDLSHLHIYVILNYLRGYQDAFFAAPYAVCPNATCINRRKKNHVDFSKVNPSSFHHSLVSKSFSYIIIDTCQYINPSINQSINQLM